MHVLMTIDAGNTNIAFGMMVGNELIGKFRMITQTTRTSDEFGVCIRSFLDACHIKEEDIDDVIISSVVPKINYALTSSIIKYIHKEPIMITSDIKTEVEIKTENPHGVGADRIVDVTYAHRLGKGSCIVCDFGTATTFDYVDKDGVFQYTVISPGLGIMADALTKQTAKLPDIEIQKPKTILQKNTIGGMQSGVVYGYIGLVEGILSRMKKELNDPDAYVIATGGLGKVLANETDMIDEYDPDIAFKGMRILYDMNK